MVDPISTVRKMVEFLPNPFLRPKNLEDRLACLSQDTTGLAKRKSHAVAFNHFPEDSRKAINQAISTMRLWLKESGFKVEMPPYENDPDYAL